MKFKMRSLLSLLLLLIQSQAFAQSGNVGNGGGGGEPTFNRYRDLLIQWMEMGVLNIDWSKSSKPVNLVEIIQGMKTIPVQFDPNAELTVGGSLERACKNYPDPATLRHRIDCNLKIWNMIIPSEQLAVVLHEYLGALGYEPNTGVFSNYPLSSQLLGTSMPTAKDNFGMLDSDSFDIASTHTVPSPVLDFVKAQISKKSRLVVQANGTLELANSVNYYDATYLKGAYLKNGNYLLNIQAYRKLSGNLGQDKIEISERGCEYFKALLIWNETLGIQSITTSTGCVKGNFTKGFESETSAVNADGSVTLERKLVAQKKWSTPIRILINQIEYTDTYQRKNP